MMVVGFMKAVVTKFVNDTFLYYIYIIYLFKGKSWCSHVDDGRVYQGHGVTLTVFYSHMAVWIMV